MAAEVVSVAAISPSLSKLAYEITIGDALASDAAAIALIGANTFTATFGYSIPASDLANFLTSTYSAEAVEAEILESQKTNISTFVAREGTGAVLGFVQLARGLSDPCLRGGASSHAELRKLYVDTAAHGRGIGSKLIAVVESRAKAEGFRQLWLTVYEENVKAQRLYQRLGYVKTSALSNFYQIQRSRMLPTDSAGHLSGSLNEPIPWVEETATRFGYDPLEEDEIRLLELEPSLSPQDPIRCSLIHANRSENHQYDILSCDWHNTSNNAQVPISLNGKTFDAPSEIWVALQRVRLEDRSRLLWTDAICINQEFDEHGHTADNPEKNLQASRLQDTYRGATSLLVWLGGAEDNSHLIFEHLERCRAHTHLNWCHYRGETEEAFRHFCKRSWFYRPFSAAELSLSKKAAILCGRHESEWRDLMKCSSFLSDADYYHPLEGPDGRSHLHHLRDISRGRRVQLRNVFLWIRHCRADDPRDKIFGILMLDTGIQFGVPIDYKQDVVQIFRNFTRKIIESSQNLEALHWLGPQKHIEGLPSWVPDYSITNPIGTLPRVYAQSATYSVHYPFKLLLGFGFRNDNTLVVRGQFIAAIGSLADGLEAKDISRPGSEKFKYVLGKWENLIVDMKTSFPQPITDAFCDTLVGEDEADLLIKDDHLPYVRKTRPPSSRWSEEFNIWYGRYGTGVLREVTNQEQQRKLGERENRLLNRYSRRMETTCYGRRLFVSSGDSIGLAPPRAREGDCIAFLPGGRYPFVLRERENGTYDLIGDCFLYDLDVFELFQGAEAKEIRLV
ncbi:hypothetical protein AAE478_000246 [Parahypoxylon ruwenzoriense]